MPEARLSRRALLKGSLATGALTLDPRAVLAASAPRRPEVAPGDGELPRRVLALYKSSELYNAVEGARPKTAWLNEVHAWAQMPLNWLGLMVDYHDVARGLPDEAQMGRYRGVLTWHQTEEIDDPLGYLQWLAAQVRAGRRLVILGNLGAYRDRKTLKTPGLDEISLALAPTGLEFRGRWTGNSRVIELRQKNAAMVEFERALPPALPNYYQVVSRRADNRVHLTIGRKDAPDSDSHLVVTGPWGGFAGEDYVRYQQAVPYAAPAVGGSARVDASYQQLEAFRTRWWINPFAFFEAALGLEDWPRPDVTTLNGRRLFYSHIDGDGMRNVSEVRPQALSGEIIHDEILSKVPLPISVSVVVAEVDPELLGSARTQGLARAMFALPNVEAASHSFTHPLDWEKRTRSFDLPRLPYSVETEIAGSVRYIEERLLPRGKRVRLFQWSGSTRVSEEALALVERLGLPNINGGDSMFDREWPSYTKVAPLGRAVGRYWQSYTSAANENLYTNLWAGPFYGFRHVVETFKSTESPRRVSPVNVYYHFYSGERVASLAALRVVYDWARRQPVAPVFTSEYLAMVEGFRTARVARAGAGYRVWDHGALRTIRFDAGRFDAGRFDAGHGAVDMTRSRGVLGFTRHQGSVYVHLEGPGEAFIVPSATPGPGPYLAGASHRVSRWQREGKDWSFKLEGIGAKSAEIGGLRAGEERRVEISGSEGTRHVRARVSTEGILALTLGDGLEVQVRVQ